MGICTSTKKNKEIKINKKNSPKTETNNDNNLNKEEKQNNSLSEEKKNEDKPINKDKDVDSDKSSDEDGEEEEEEEKKKKEKEKEKKINKEKQHNSNIIISYINNGKTEFQQDFKTNDNISSLFDILLVKKSKYAEYDLTTNEHLSLSSKYNDKIGTIFKEAENAEINMVYLGLDISNDIKADYENSNTVLGVPLFDLGGDIGLLIYHKNEKNFSTEIIKNNKLSKFNHLSSFCNGKNFLYLSGGDNNKSKSTNFFSSVDLLNLNSINELPILNIARSWHSMIFIPKRYIYIVGGGTDEVELFDVEKKSLIIDSKMNEIRNESTLFVINNSVLYAFCGISVEGTFLSTVERCNLRQKERKWSLVNYTTADNTLFEECFYVASFFSDNSIILFAANEDDKNEFSNILFDLEDEDNPTLSYYESGGKIIDVVPEKIFHPFGENTSIMIPLVGTIAKIYKIDDALKLNIDYFPEVLKNIME